MHPRIGLDVGSHSLKAVLLGAGDEITELAERPVLGRPLEQVRDALRELRGHGVEKALLGVTGAGAPGVSELSGIPAVDEIAALAQAFRLIDPEVRTVIEMGRESQRYLLIGREPRTGRMLVEQSALGHKCAAGTGSFLDHMHRRLHYATIEEFAEVGLRDDRPAGLAGRCGVFTESDIVHLYQRGTPKERIVAGIHQAICRSYKSAVLKRNPLEGKVAFVGGVSRNPAVRKYLHQELALDGRLEVPPHNTTACAIGAALEATREIALDDLLRILDDAIGRPLDYHATEPLRLRDSVFCEAPACESLPSVIARAGLGVDIGSVSTKAALVAEIDGRTVVLACHYRRTEGSPIDAVRDTLRQIRRQLEERGVAVEEIVAGTTGSGRYLTADLIGADVVRNEITAQANGTRCFAPEIDTILEIGGQDSKYIRLADGVITDFEMNRACAAGTGAFLEKQAQHLGYPIEQFGDRALEGTRPPELDWQCTVFSESAMVHFQQNNVPSEDLAAAVCLAAVRNYLNKNVASRSLGERIAFQGAVAFNRGMVAALETLLDRPITVPPYPHLTGALGVASLALREGPTAGSAFIGFEAVESAEYAVGSFECKACPNRCEVNTFRLGDGPTFYTNDRCERFSAERVSRRAGPTRELPDLFAEYGALLLAEWHGEEAGTGPRVGVPRGLFFADYFPLWCGFLEALGCTVVPGPATTRQTVQRGLELTLAEPCFPIKVAHGQLAEVLGREVDFVFLPGVHDTEQPNPNWNRSESCPYVQGAPDVLVRSLDPALVDSVRILSPRLRLSRGRGHLVRVLGETAAQLGVRDRGTVAAAVDAGLAALERFRAAVRRRGEEVLGALEDDQRAFVVLGRPYALHDTAVNMSIGRRIRDLGILAIPQDFLPLDDEDPSDHWGNAFSRQVQKRLAAARCLRGDPKLRAVVLTYFGCGPDSFGNPFFREELGGPCYVMQIDEHTADAGVITRIEAFADTVRAGVAAGAPTEIRSAAPPLTLDNHAGRRIWIPNLSGGAEILAGAMRAWGLNAEVLPPSPDPGLNRARAAISEDVCLPTLITTEDMLWRAEAEGFEPRGEAFFQGSAQGPCRYGMYSMLQRRVLDRLGHTETDVVSLGIGTAEGGPGVGFVLATYTGFVAVDLLRKLLFHTRPYERTPGASDRLFAQYLRELVDILPTAREGLSTRAGLLRALLGRNLGPWEEVLARAARDFQAVPRRQEERPLIGVVGEFYLRMHPRANQEIIRKLEAAGAEAWLAPLSELFAYANYQTGWIAEDLQRDAPTWRGWLEILLRRFLRRVSEVSDHRLHHALGHYVATLEDAPIGEILRKGSEWIHPQFGGEAILSMGKAADLADRGLDGIVSVTPFHCMPGMIVAALSHPFRREAGGIPFLNLEYDGFEDSARDAQIRALVRQAADRMALRGAPTA